MNISNAFWRDANRVPITQHGLFVTKSLSLTANGTVTAPIFSITGEVEVYALYGVVTTTLGSNVTAGYWRLNDQGAQVDISLNTGTTLSNAAVGSTITRRSVATVALSLTNASAGAILDPVAATAPDVFMPFVAVQKVGSIETDIEFCYTTNNTSLGAITFYCGFIPLNDSSTIAAI